MHIIVYFYIADRNGFPVMRAARFPFDRRQEAIEWANNRYQRTGDTRIAVYSHEGEDVIFLWASPRVYTNCIACGEAMHSNNPYCSEQCNEDINDFDMD